MNQNSLRQTVLRASVLLVFTAAPAQPCSPAERISSSEMVRRADVIVRAVAFDYATSPANSGIATTGVPDSIVRFKVVEVLKGNIGSEEVFLPGYLTDRDDFNDQPPPYTFVRAGGQAGSCFANSYRHSAEFLLVLKGSGTSFTVNWDPLGPVNEQLRSNDDPWLLWVRSQVRQEGSDALARARAEILPLLEAMQTAANAHDADRHVSFYARDPTLLFVINDEAIVGYDALLEKQRQWWQNGKSDVVYTMVGSPDFRMPAPNLVMVTYFLKSHRTLPDGSARDTRFGISALWQKRPEGWRIIYAHESTVNQ